MMRVNKGETLRCRVTQDQKKEVELAAQKDGRTVSGLILIALRKLGALKK